MLAAYRKLIWESNIVLFVTPELSSLDAKYPAYFLVDLSTERSFQWFNFDLPQRLEIEEVEGQVETDFLELCNDFRVIHEGCSTIIIGNSK